MGGQSILEIHGVGLLLLWLLLWLLLMYVSHFAQVDISSHFQRFFFVRGLFGFTVFAGASLACGEL
jgi:hypothetical protein